MLHQDIVLRREPGDEVRQVTPDSVLYMLKNNILAVA